MDFDKFTERTLAQEAISDEINTAKLNIEKTAKPSQGYISARLEHLSKLWDTFCKAHIEIVTASPQFEKSQVSELSYFSSSVYMTTERMYFEIVGKLWDATEVIKKGSQALEFKSKLPTPKLPTFDGSYSNWRSFHDQFVSRVHSKVGENVDKMDLLKDCLSGEAKEFLSRYDSTDNNYPYAWKALCSRYDNRRILINTQLRKLFNLPMCLTDNSKIIRNLIDRVNECIDELRALKVNSVIYWDDILVYLLSNKLAAETLKEWEEKIGDSTEPPKFDALLKFLESRFRTLEAIESTKKPANDSQVRQGKTLPKTQSFHSVKSTSANLIRNHPSSSTTACIYCKGSHSIRKCKKFQSISVNNRIQFVKSANLCYNCLSNQHMTKDCKSRNCFKCPLNHHTLLHFDTKITNRHDNVMPHSNNTATALPSNELKSIPLLENPTILSSKNETVTTNLLVSSHEPTVVLLATALVDVISFTGIRFTFRALLDTGSESNFITARAFNLLEARSSNVCVEVQGLDHTITATTKKQACLTIHSRLTNVEPIDISTFVIKRISEQVPAHQVNIQDCSHFRKLNLADPTFNYPGKVDLLLGSAIFAHILTDGLIKGDGGTPTAQNTVFGWIIFGKTTPTTIQTVSLLSTMELNLQLSNQLKQFWEFENLNEKQILTEDEIYCERFYDQSTKRLLDGTYEVRIPFKNDKRPQLGYSRTLATNRFHHLERKFQKNNNLFSEYSKCINDYLQEQHLIPIANCSSADSKHAFPGTIRHYFVPHHAVFKESSSTTKLRIVFDFSAKTSNKKCLNEQMFVGPILQRKLYSIILNWRLHKYVLTADIRQMYRQIRIHASDQSYQQILWRNSNTEELKCYMLTRLTFGAAAAPYLAIKTLNRLADDESENYPVAAPIVKRDFYVDDLLTGASTLSEAKTIQNQLISLLESGGFPLRKWSSNKAELLDGIPTEHIERNPLDISVDDSMRALGICWNPNSDMFSFKFNSEMPVQIWSKRTVLSDISKLFDPLGWLSPIIITGKIFIQKLWLTGCDWDTQLNDNLLSEWKTYRLQLNAINSIKIPRWLNFSLESERFEVIGFCDASTVAYSAVLYLRIQHENGDISTNLLISKTRVAPLKPLTLPKLELCGATLLSELFQQVQTDMYLQKVPIYAFCDSTITLCWIKSNPNRWKTFIANRVTRVQQNIPTGSWAHIKSSENPADLPSRGIMPENLVDNQLWWHGPAWLSKSAKFWPVSKKIPDLGTNFEFEEKGVTHVFHTIDVSVCEFLLRFSTYTRMLRSVAYVLRFCRNCCIEHTYRNFNHLTSDEVDFANKVLIKLVQKSNFPNEIRELTNGNQILKSSALLPLHPFIDGEGILRVGGRLQNANVAFDQTHPIILPNSHHYTKLLVEKVHFDTLHGGTQLMMSTIRLNYWIIKGRNLVKFCSRKCTTCIRHRQETTQQLMGSLPPSRVTASRPFSHVGIDFAGPLTIKLSAVRNSKTAKCFLSIFVCMSTKSAHIEVVSDYSTSAFLAAFKRFAARRGKPSDIYSDQGTNFVGASNTLQRDLNAFLSHLLSSGISEITDQNINWHFIPPAAPNFGGLWEAAVKSTKHHLIRVLKNAMLTFEELATVVTQIEACLNSRPLCPINDDPQDLQILTPGHFLTGSNLLTVPEPSCLDVSHPNNRWKLLQKLKQMFWKCWYSDYISMLQSRPKWMRIYRNPKVGDVVLVKHENIPPGRWPLGRIIEVHPGVDKLVRVVKLKTETGTIVRSISKLIPIAYANNEVIS